MAIDAWMLDQVIAGHPPILRFYRWQPAAISLGYHQKRWPNSWRTLLWQHQPIELVRRPTGGRAVLHQGDFTYAIACPMLSQRPQDTYQRIGDALIAAWQRFDMALTYGTAGRGYHHQPSCFATATAADLVTATGYKLIGSAQLRRDHHLLQQGTMRLWPDLDLYRQVFNHEVNCNQIPAGIPTEPADAWLQHLRSTIVKEIETRLGIVFHAAPLTAAEHQGACQKYAAKFGTVMTP